jgi:L-aminopeptidase/D-esterase-like protein
MQCNFGSRDELRIAGVSMRGVEIPHPMGDNDWLERDKSRVVPGGAGSVIAVIATDAPLLPHQCEALARRVSLGLARTGTTGGHFSGDIFIAFSTACAGELSSGFPHTASNEAKLKTLEFVPWNYMDRFYAATVETVEEAVINSLICNETMVGRDGNTSFALPHDLVKERIS